MRKEVTMEKMTNYNITYIPNGFELMDAIKQSIFIRYEYVGPKDGKLIILMSLPDAKIYMDTEGTSLEEVKLKNGCGYYSEKNGKQHVIFDQGGYSFVVAGTISKQELLIVADGIRLRKKWIFWGVE